MKREYKSIEFKVDEKGQVSSSIATFGVVDHDGDIVESTAFTDGQEVAMVWSHDWSRPVGKGVIRVTATEAHFEGAFFMDTADGQESYKTVKAMGDLQEWSWGFRVTQRMIEETAGGYIRHIQKADVYEVSPVLKGAGVGTATLGIKGMRTLEEEIEMVLDAVNSLGERVRSLKGMRQEENRKINQERADEIKGLAKSLKDCAAGLEESLQEPASDAGRKEFARYQKFIARLNGVPPIGCDKGE